MIRSLPAPRMGVRFALAAVVAVGTLATLALPAMADDSDQSSLTATLTAGPLQFTPAPSDVTFDAIEITGAATSTSGTLSQFGILDATGTGAGYHVVMQGTQFAADLNSDGDTDDEYEKLPENSLTVPSLVTTAGSGVTATAPSAAAAVQVDNVNGAQVLSAGANEGLGEFKVEPTTLELAIPASVRAGAYSSTLTVSLVTGP